MRIAEDILCGFIKLKAIVRGLGQISLRRVNGFGLWGRGGRERDRIS